MDDETFDDIMDRIPAHQRNKILKVVDDDFEPHELPKPPEVPKFKLFLTMFVACMATFVGLVLCLSIVGIPIGVPLILIGCKPVHNVLRTHMNRKVTYEEKVKEIS